MELHLEELEAVENPYSNDFWTGVGIGAGAGLAVIGLAVALT